MTDLVEPLRPDRAVSTGGWSWAQKMSGAAALRFAAQWFLTRVRLTVVELDGSNYPVDVPDRVPSYLLRIASLLDDNLC
jgi:hypothetical protein